MGTSYTRIHHDVRRVSRNVQDRLGRHVERLKPGLRHPLSESLGVRGQNETFFRRNTEFVVERLMPNFLRVVPIRNDTVLDNGAQYLYPALGWRHRSHRGGSGRPRKSTTRVHSEVATPRMGATHMSKDTLSQNGCGSLGERTCSFKSLVLPFKGSLLSK